MPRNPLVHTPKLFRRGFSSLHRAMFQLSGGRLHPAWYLNLRANPEVGVAAGRRTFRACQEATTREIPVVLLDPLDAPAPTTS